MVPRLPNAELVSSYQYEFLIFIANALTKNKVNLITLPPQTGLSSWQTFIYCFYTMSKDPKYQQFQAKIKEKLSKKNQINLEDFKNDSKKDINEENSKVSKNDAKSPEDLLIDSCGQYVVLHLEHFSD